MPSISRYERNLEPTGDPDEYESLTIEVFAVTEDGEPGDSLGVYDSNFLDDADLPDEYIAVELFFHYVREV